MGPLRPLAQPEQATRDAVAQIEADYRVAAGRHLETRALWPLYLLLREIEPDEVLDAIELPDVADAFVAFLVERHGDAPRVIEFFREEPDPAGLPEKIHAWLARRPPRAPFQQVQRDAVVARGRPWSGAAVVNGEADAPRSFAERPSARRRVELRVLEAEQLRLSMSLNACSRLYVLARVATIQSILDAIQDPLLRSEYLAYLTDLHGSGPSHGFKPRRRDSADPDWLADDVHAWLSARVKR
jgi:hypothetical protein